MKCTHFYLLLGILITSALRPGANELLAAEDRPNIVFILADDMGWSDLGCYGADLYETPHIDSLAANGVKFTDAYAMPVCTPTRAALMTGRHAAQVQMTIWSENAIRGGPLNRKLLPVDSLHSLPHSETTLAKHLHEAGYLTALGRSGCPVIRYRTSDLVRPLWDHDQESRFVFLDGGVLGRTDDMMIIRGVNIYPSAIEHILRGFPEVVEYQMTVCKEGEMDSLSIEIEDRLEQPERVAEELQLRLALRVDVRCVPLGSLPRYEAKSRRFVDLRRS